MSLLLPPSHRHTLMSDSGPLPPPLQVYGFRPSVNGICDNTSGGATSFVKAHVTPDHHVTVWGNVSGAGGT